MDPISLRLECLRMATAFARDASEAIEIATRLFEFVSLSGARKGP